MTRFKLIVLATTILPSCTASAESWNKARGECIVVAEGDLFANREPFDDCMSQRGWRLIDTKKDNDPNNDNKCPRGADVENCYERSQK